MNACSLQSQLDKQCDPFFVDVASGSTWSLCQYGDNWGGGGGGGGQPFWGWGRRGTDGGFVMLLLWRITVFYPIFTTGK